MEVSIRKKLGKFQLDVQFETEDPNLGVLGASGSGKSMTLKCIAGIVTPDEGRIVIGGRVVYDSQKKINIKPQKRRVGYLFQDYALFPTYTAMENIAAGLQHKSARQKKEIVDGLISRFHLEGLEKHYPHQLSGGQQQRVALARIVACEPEAILLDEPFSALDSHLRLQMQLETREILKNYDASIMVTHNREEAYQLCSALLVVDGGKVTATGKREQIFNKPQTRKTAMLVGCKNISRIVRESDRTIRALDWGGLVLHLDRTPDDTIRYVGIHANRLVPLFEESSERENLIRIRILDQIETPYEKQISFINADGEAADNQTGLWWDCGRNAAPDLPAHLYLPPEDLLLLAED
ncbi:MAG: ATP-binding cassette domain-containing protein [Clostridiales bacterium]|nr:ATP-binding cassette domain-containing protein [Clostridiales bacterium]